MGGGTLAYDGGAATGGLGKTTGDEGLVVCVTRYRVGGSVGSAPPELTKLTAALNTTAKTMTARMVLSSLGWRIVPAALESL
jgi:hypothetical protein